MKYAITKCTTCGEEFSNSELMEYDKALELYKTIYKQAMRGFRPFPQLVDKNGNIVEV